MSEPTTNHLGSEETSNEAMEFTGEESLDSQITPAQDLGSACVIGALAVFVMIMSVQLDSPGDVFTAPGLLPFIISVSLLLMAILLGFKSLQTGGARQFTTAFKLAVKNYFSDELERRSILLIVIVIAYVVLVDIISFDFRLPTRLFIVQLSGYEIISILVTTLILKLFWKKSLVRCFIISLLIIEVLASIFRYGFSILMPESF
ncbi:MAG: tripartite tricarboxylate transporter TctB family protein [Arenicellaceae bacterium]|nr:tripartite tricarboxylate transporter TctB family protein [Arenicellaceae bacterium]